MNTQKTIKRFLLTVIALIGVLPVVSCAPTAPEKEEVEYTLEVKLDNGTTPSELSVGKEATTINLNITSNGEWQISIPEEDSWVSVDVPSGNSDVVATLEVETNSTYEERTSYITISLNGMDEMWFSLTQAPTIPDRMSVSSVSPVPNFGIKGGSLLIELNTNTKWNYTIVPESDWIEEGAKGEHSLTLNIAEGGYEERSADVVFRAENSPELTDTVTITQARKLLFEVACDTITLANEGGLATIDVTTNTEWEYTVTDGYWLTEEELTEGKLSLRAEQAGFEARTAIVTITSSEDASLTASVVVTQQARERIVADLLDVVFNEDGSAKDISPMRMTVKKMDGSQLITYYNEAYGRYVAHFNNSLGTSTSSSFYQVNFSTKPKFKEALADGHTLEAIIKMDEPAKGISGEIKPFTAHQAGGTGLMLAAASRGNDITFLPNVSTTGKSAWCWAESNVVPQAGEYYHVVGVWDKAAGQARIYVNGKSRGAAAARGELVFPSSTSYQWFGIGADPGGANTGSNCFKGDIVVARIYDDALTSEQVQQLYEQSTPATEPQKSFSIKDIAFMTDCQLKGGYGYAIYGEGFSAGDRLQMTATKGEKAYTLDLTVKDNSAYVVIPADFTSGEYRMMVLREDKSFPLGVTNLTICENPILPGKPNVIAHRGVHSSVPENSIESFIAAQNLGGVYGAEFDVHITADGYVVSNHDATISGAKIDQTNYDDLPLRNNKKLPLLEAYFAEVLKNPGMKMIIELKNQSSAANNKALADAVVKAVKDNNMEEHAEYISYGYDMCTRIVEIMPSAIVAYLTDNKAPSVLKAAGIKGLDYEYNRLLTTNRKWIAEAKEVGVFINMYTVNNAADMMKCIAAGADYITTDNCPLLKSLVAMDFILTPDEL